MAFDPFEFTTADFFSFEKCENITLQLSTPARYVQSFWLHGDVMGLPKELKHRIAAKELHTCHFCGFTNSQKYQEIVVRNGQEWRHNNAKAACIFCAQCFTVDWVANRRSGLLIHLPEISQNELNRLLKLLYVFRISQGTLANKARKLLEILTKRRDKAKQILTDDPSILARELKSCVSHEAYETLTMKIKDIRLMPLDRRIIREADLEFNQFPQILAFWRSSSGPLRGKKLSNCSSEKLDEYINRLSSTK